MYANSSLSRPEDDLIYDAINNYLMASVRGGLVRSDRISEFLSGIAVAIKLPILSLAAWRSMLHPASDRRGSNEAGFGYTSSGSCRLSGGHGLPSHRL